VQQLLQWKRRKYYIFWVCVCSLTYPTCNVHVLYCHLRPVWHCNIFPHYLIKARFSKKKKLLNIKCVFWFFSTTFVWNISQYRKKWARYDQKMFIGLHVKYLLLLSDFNENVIFSTDFQKTLKYQISWKSNQWEPSCTTQMDRWRLLTTIFWSD